MISARWRRLTAAQPRLLYFVITSYSIHYTKLYDTLLKLPHHGSRNSSPQLLLEGLQPKLAFVSLGAGNPYRFPHREVLAELEERNIPLYRTDRAGSVRFLSNGSGWRVEQWQRGLFR